MEHQELPYAKVVEAATTLGIRIPELVNALKSIGFEHIVDRAGMQRDVLLVDEPPRPG